MLWSVLHVALRPAHCTLCPYASAVKNLKRWSCPLCHYGFPEPSIPLIPQFVVLSLAVVLEGGCSKTNAKVAIVNTALRGPRVQFVTCLTSANHEGTQEGECGTVAERPAGAAKEPTHASANRMRAQEPSISHAERHKSMGFGTRMRKSKT